MIDQPILRGIMLRLQSTEQRLLGTKDLHRTRRVLRQTEQAARMTDQTCPHELADECRQIRGNGVHAVAEVFCELGAVGGDCDDLVA
jgi:hypothetical protein